MRVIPRALLFDVFGTLVDWRTSVARELRAALAAVAGPRDWAALADAWRAGYQPAMEEIRSGRRAFVPLDTLHGEMLDQVVSEHDLPPLQGATRDRLVRAWHRLDPWPDAPGGLARLRARHLVAPLSNGNVALMANLARHAGFVWDAVLGAEFARAYKPGPAVYLDAARALDLAPAHCMMVAAHNDDLAAARALRLATAFVPRPTEHGPDQTTDLHPSQDWDVVAPDLHALAACLDARLSSSPRPPR